MSGERKDGSKGQPDDVRDMLRQLASQIKDQIADVDRRHNAAMKSMEQRLVLPAQSLGDGDVWDMDSAEALTRLYENDHVPQTQPAPIEAAPNASKLSAQQLTAPVAAPRPPMRATTPPTAPIYFADPPMPLPPAAVAPPASKPQTAMPTSAFAAPVAALAVAAPSAAAAAGWLASDRTWLDQRLADLHAKVDATLSSFDPAPFIAPVNDRIDRLENHFADALSKVAQTSDLARLGGIESDVAALKGHVEDARDQLKRLDGIEHNLAGLKDLAEQAQSAVDGVMPDNTAGRLAEIEAMLRDLHAYAADQQAQPAATPELPDFHGLAEKAAERTAQNIVEQHKDLFSPAKRAELHAQALAQAATGPSLDDMQTLLDRYQDEQRREQEQMSATLMTMQEALVRLIDRIEELAGEEPPVAADAPHAAPRFVEVHDERSVQPGRRANDRPTQFDASQAAAAAVPAAPPRSAAHVAASGAASGAAPEPQMDIEDSAAALAAERARVQADRAQKRRAPTPRPQMTVAPDPAEAPADDATATVRAPRKPKPKAPISKRIMVAAAASGLCILGAGAYMMLGQRVADTKLGDRIPRVTPATVPAAAQPSQRPQAPKSGIPTETFETPGNRAQPTPPLPEAQPQLAPRAQPIGGTPLPTQPAAQVAPAPQAAPQGRIIETPAAPNAPRRPLPETVTDDLSSNTQEPNRPSFSEVMGARVSTAVVQGIALDQSGSAFDPTELARRQARLAPPDSGSARIAAETVDNTPEALARGRADMPPPQIGPMSLRVAAQQGDPAAAFEVGARFAEAKGVKQDFQQAIVWYSRAAQQGFGPAQYRLATIYEGGLHGTQDLTRAKVWYKRAADQGNVKAMHNLAVLATGNGQSQPDYNTAARWFAEAAERGLADSQFNLGVLHESGLGVAKDPMQAYKWFALAARSGDKEALRRRDQMMATFSPQAGQQAEKLVQMWRGKPTDLKANDPRAAGQAWREAQARAMEEQQQRMQAQQQSRQGQVQPLVEAPAQPADGKQAAKALPKVSVQRATASIPRQ